MKWFLYITIAAATLMAGSAFAQKPGSVPVTEEGIDLLGNSFTYKVKQKQGVTSVNNLTFYIANQGDSDAPNSRIEYWLSDDAVFNEVADPMVPGSTADVLIHTQSLGKVKSGKTKKRTVGGGLLKGLGVLTGKYYIAVIDADNVLLEADEVNNTFTSQIPN